MIDDWFQVNKIQPNIFAISEPFHWEKVRSYLFLGSNKALLVDTGTGICDISMVIKQFASLPVVVITTHCHWDHTGSHDKFKTIMIHREDAEWLKNGIPIPIGVIRKQVMKEPFNPDLCPDFDINNYQPPVISDPTILEDGDFIENGRHKLRVIHTPGHSPGSICLFEENDRILITGDTLYRGTIYANYPGTDPAALCNSIIKLDSLNPLAILPGHNDDMLDCSILNRAAELAFELKEKKLAYHGSGLHEKNDICFLF